MSFIEVVTSEWEELNEWEWLNLFIQDGDILDRFGGRG